MKKIATLLAIMLFAACGSAFAAGSALSEDAVTTTDGMQIYGGVDAGDAARDAAVLLGKMSKGVKFRSDFDNLGFAAATYHTSGSKSYGTAHNSTAIYFQDVGTGAADSAWSLSDPHNGAFGTAWTKM